MAKPRLKAEIVPNQDIRLYHVNFELCPLELQEYSALPESAKILLDGIKGIPGVLRVDLYRYMVRVEKAPLFGWEAIEPDIVGLVKAVYQSIVGEIEYGVEPLCGYGSEDKVHDTVVE